jgi:ABC-type Fe3+-siderophore transport system permease subunit
MTYPESNITFNLEYSLSIIIIIIVTYFIIKKYPQMNIFIIIIIGLVVKWISLFFMNLLFPAVSETSVNIYQYALLRSMKNFTSTGYMHIWPPILAVLVIFIILIYNKKLG